MIRRIPVHKLLSLILLLLSRASGWTSTSFWRLSPVTNCQKQKSVLHLSNNDNAAGERAPVLVVGATGRVGRQVVRQLLSQNQPVRALVRSADRASKLFGTAATNDLDVRVADISRFDDLYTVELDDAVRGCSAIISVSGTVRMSKLTDFLPWRIFSRNYSSWIKDPTHPFFANYKGQLYLLSLAEKHGVSRFIRLTGLGLSLSAFNPFTLLFNTLLSFSNRWGILCEQAIVKSKVPHVILRPGGLLDDERNTTTTSLQVDPSGTLPFPARCGRADVAALAVASLSLPSRESYTLACRWCGKGVTPKVAQGNKEDGFSSAEECLDNLVASDAKQAPAPAMKPYGVAVAISTYFLASVCYRVAKAFWLLANRLLWGK